MAYFGEATVSVLDEDSSTAAGTDIDSHLLGMSLVKDEKKEHKQTRLAKFSTVVLHEKQAMWIPFGCVHCICPLPTKRDTKVSTDAKSKSKPGRSKKQGDSEHTSFLWIPVLSESHAKAAPATICATYARWMSHKPHSPAGWE